MRIEITGQARLASEKRSAVAGVNRMIDQARRLFITPIVGQEMIYLEKGAEALRFVNADPEPTDLTDYPFIAAEVGVTATTAYEVAQLYLNLGAQWRFIGAALENLRLSSTSAVNASTSLAGVASEEAAAAQAIQGFLSGYQ